MDDSMPACKMRLLASVCSAVVVCLPQCEQRCDLAAAAASIVSCVCAPLCCSLPSPSSRAVRCCRFPPVAPHCSPVVAGHRRGALGARSCRSPPLVSAQRSMSPVQRAQCKERSAEESSARLARIVWVEENDSAGRRTREADCRCALAAACSVQRRQLRLLLILRASDESSRVRGAGGLAGVASGHQHERGMRSSAGVPSHIARSHCRLTPSPAATQVGLAHASNTESKRTNGISRGGKRGCHCCSPAHRWRRLGDRSPLGTWRASFDPSIGVQFDM